MRRAPALAGLVACVAGSVHAATEVEPWLDAWLARELDEAPAPPLAVAVLLDGRIVLEKGYGGADPNSSVFRAASLTKLVTATAVVQLVERGRLRLDDGVALPTGGHQPTLRELLTHTSGLDDPLFGLSEPAGPAPERLEHWLEEHPPRFGRPARQTIVYSNLGFGIAGLAVERAAGVSLEEYVEREIFAPLGMVSSSLRQPPPADLASRAVPSGAENVRLVAPGGGALTTTAHDMARFLAAHLGEGSFDDHRILSAAATRMMHEHAFGNHPALPGIALGFFESDHGGRRGLYHTGASGHVSVAYLLPEERAGVFVVLAPTPGVSPELRRNLVHAFLERFFPPPTGSPGSASQVTPCPPIAGTFRPNLLPRSRIERVGEIALDTRVRVENGDLLLELPPLGSKKLHLRPAGSGVFRDATGYAAAFVCDVAGPPRQLVLTGPLFEPVTLDRVVWIERGLVHAVLGGMLGLLWLLCAGGSIVHVLRRRRPARLYLGLAAGVGWATLLAPVAATLVYFPGDPELRPYKVTSAMTVAAALLLIGALFAAALPVAGSLEWRRSTLRARLLLLALSSAAVAWIAWLWHWNLLGFRF